MKLGRLGFDVSGNDKDDTDFRDLMVDFFPPSFFLLLLLAGA